MPSPIYQLTAQDLRETDQIRRVGPENGRTCAAGEDAVTEVRRRPRGQRPRRGSVLCAYWLPGRRRRAAPFRVTYNVPGRPQ